MFGNVSLANINLPQLVIARLRGPLGCLQRVHLPPQDPSTL